MACQMIQFPLHNGQNRNRCETIQAPSASRLQVPDLLRRFDVRRLPDVRFGREEVQVWRPGIRSWIKHKMRTI